MTEGDVTTGADEALAHLEAVLRSLGHPLLDLLEPGLSSEQMVETVAPTGLALPHEAAAVWRWRNGLRPGAHDPAAVPSSNELPGGFVLLSLQRAAAMYLRNLAEFPWDQLDDLSRDWFPFAIGSGSTMWAVAVTCGTPTGTCHRVGPAEGRAGARWHPSMRKPPFPYTSAGFPPAGDTACCPHDAGIHRFERCRLRPGLWGYVRRMTDHGDTVLRGALALPADERAQVAVDLLASLDEEHEPGGEVISCRAVEVERRARQVVDGQSSGEDWDVARDRIAGQLRSG